MGNSQFQRQKDYDNAIRSCIDYAVCLVSRGNTPYQAECGVLSVVYFCQGPAKPPQNKRKRAPHFCFTRFNGARNRNESNEMRISLKEADKREAYYPPTSEVVCIQHEHTIMSGDDDDDTGGTGHNMPWDD